MRRDRWAAVVLTAVGVVLLAACAALGAPPGERVFYVSAAGDDTRRGTSPDEAWRTLDRASAAVLLPGERLLLEGGSRFTGRLLIDAADAGDPDSPLVIGSYGQGRAVIEGHADSAVAVVDTAGVEIADLVVVGPGTVQPGSAGIRFFSELAEDGRLGHAVVERVEASGFVHGIEVGSSRAGTGFRDVRIADSVVHGNRDAGLAVYGPEFDAADPRFAHEAVTVSGVTAHDNAGDAANLTRNTGSGIALGSVRGGTVTRSVAHDNGGSGGAGEGPVGIWTYDSTGVVIEHSLSYRNRTAKLADGGGFGLDQNTADSVLQYNLSYDNHGPGYLVYTGRDNDAHTGSTVRFNVSSGDARRWSVYGGITVLGRVDDVRIYQNTVVMAPQASDPSSALRLGPGITAVEARNNLLVSDAAGPLVLAESGFDRGAVALDGNAYVADGVDWSLIWGPQEYSSLGEWSAGTGQEPGGSGLDTDPLLPGPLVGLEATVPGDAAALAGFAPGADSPLRGAGLDLTDLLAPGTALSDLAGAPVRVGAPDIGALQAQPG
ncbi:right-handed parallel beta-helix repeat-containing protein [Pseudonocardia sp.]|uniref:right-handed parallel beta-helix repeat-containing protein n=1 Tax=Pseudonocardia sp. TaxID=60912 RepID=UPI002639EBF7|nr:right-handed parallel beta-helix repeat-containing protein [Pseudonocardia sp.]